MKRKCVVAEFKKNTLEDAIAGPRYALRSHMIQAVLFIAVPL